MNACPPGFSSELSGVLQCGLVVRASLTMLRLTVRVSTAAFAFGCVFKIALLSYEGDIEPQRHLRPRCQMIFDEHQSSYFLNEDGRAATGITHPRNGAVDMPARCALAQTSPKNCAGRCSHRLWNGLFAWGEQRNE